MKCQVSQCERKTCVYARVFVCVCVRACVCVYVRVVGCIEHRLFRIPYTPSTPPLGDFQGISIFHQHSIIFSATNPSTTGFLSNPCSSGSPSEVPPFGFLSFHASTWCQVSTTLTVEFVLFPRLVPFITTTTNEKTHRGDFISNSVQVG